MKYRYMVLQDGVIYPAGSEVPEITKETEALETVPPITENSEPKKRAGRPKKTEV